MNINFIRPIAIFFTCAVLTSGCGPVPENDTIATTETAQPEVSKEQAMYQTQSAAVVQMMAGWENRRHEALYLRASSTHYYQTLYDSLSGLVICRQDSKDAVTDLVIQLTVSRNIAGDLDGGPNENRIYELHQQDGLQYISIRSDSRNPVPLREYMCRRSSMSVDYLPEFKDTELEES